VRNHGQPQLGPPSLQRPDDTPRSISTPHANKKKKKQKKKEGKKEIKKERKKGKRKKERKKERKKRRNEHFIILSFFFISFFLFFFFCLPPRQCQRRCGRQVADEQGVAPVRARPHADVAGRAVAERVQGQLAMLRRRQQRLGAQQAQPRQAALDALHHRLFGSDGGAHNLAHALPVALRQAKGQLVAQHLSTQGRKKERKKERKKKREEKNRKNF
jgi:hypothetical protein